MISAVHLKQKNQTHRNFKEIFVGEEGKTKMSNELAYLLAPATDMDEIDQLLAEEEEQNQELVQI